MSIDYSETELCQTVFQIGRIIHCSLLQRNIWVGLRSWHFTYKFDTAIYINYYIIQNRIKLITAMMVFIHKLLYKTTEQHVLHS